VTALKGKEWEGITLDPKAILKVQVKSDIRATKRTEIKPVFVSELISPLSEYKNFSEFTKWRRGFWDSFVISPVTDFSLLLGKMVLARDLPGLKTALSTSDHAILWNEVTLQGENGFTEAFNFSNNVYRVCKWTDTSPSECN
jgi:hypothetical protein